MKRLALAVLLAAPVVLSASAASAQSGPAAGRLTCNVGGGIGLIITSQRPMDCRYAPRRGPSQRYAGVVRNFGLDVGTIGRSTMTWRVYGPYARAPLGALTGGYAGATAGASIVAGASGNLLVGGPGRAVTLQPLSIQASRGINVAVGVTGFDLSPVRPLRRR